MVCRNNESKKEYLFITSKNRKEGISVMTSDEDMAKAFPQSRQVGGSHYKNFHIQPYEFISKNNLSFFQGCVVKYVCRYLRKDRIKDLEKIIHYCELEILKLQDTRNKK
jgi:hypothetical protein